MDAEPFVLENLLNLWLLARASTVFVGRTLRAGTAPGVWSGFELATQELEIEVELCLCGPVPAAEKLTLALPVVKGARISAPTPELASWLTAPGARAIYFIENRSVVDEDLGVIAATDENVARVRALCGGQLPAGTGPVLYLLAEASRQRPALKEVFASIEPTVVDVVDGARRSARLTVSKGELRVFTGIRFRRVAGTREPDALLYATAAQLGRWLTGEFGPGQPLVTGQAQALIAALGRAADLVRQDPALATSIKEAGGLPAT